MNPSTGPKLIVRDVRPAGKSESRRYTAMAVSLEA